MTAGEPHTAAGPCLFTVNGGSSSIKFAVFSLAPQPQPLLSGQVERIGSSGAALKAVDAAGHVIDERPIEAADHGQAAELLADWLRDRVPGDGVRGVGHRVVHGGVRLVEHQPITDAVLAELYAARPLDLAHLPREIALIEVFRRRFPDATQVACFDTAFHRDLPTLARLLPIPRRYADAGVRRLGFHGLSYTYLMSELRRLAPREAEGKVVLAHLGSGASMAAVRGGTPFDTTMGFTPLAGLVMATRPGDLDPGVVTYLMREEKLTPERMDDYLSRRCGMMGVSDTSGDLRDLTARRSTDSRAAEAIDLFCYQARKFVGAFAAAMAGLDTLVFSGGIGEHSPEVRAAVCDGLQFLGLRLDNGRNAAGAAVISADGSTVTARVVPTDEEIVMARIVADVIVRDRA
jgi:acetate kinase